MIRPATVADATNLAALAIQVWLHTYAKNGISSAFSHYVLGEFTAEKFMGMAEDPDVQVLLAEVGDNLIGYVLVRFGAESASTHLTAEVATLYVQEHFERRGVGTALLAAARSAAERRTGSRGVWLTVNARNERALAFYRDLGYTSQGIDYFELAGEKHRNLVLVSPESE